MNNWQVDLFTGLQQSNNIQDVLDTTIKIIRPLGFDFCGLRTSVPLPISQPKILAFQVDEDQKLFEKTVNGGFEDSPLNRHCARSMTPFAWQGTTSDEVFLQAPDILEDYYAFGHRGGWAQSLVESRRMYSMFWADSRTTFSSQDLESFDFRMQWVATAVLSRMNKVGNDSNIALSLREKEILRWTGDGKTADQIAEILTLSHSTVNFHLRNAMKKLDAPNKTAAVVRAIFLKLLF